MIANKLKKYVIEVVVGKNNSGIGNQQCWLGLLTAAPVDDATAVQYPTYAEVTGTGYQRTFLNEYSSGTVDTDKVVVTVEDGKVIAKILTQFSLQSAKLLTGQVLHILDYSHREQVEIY